MYTIRHWRVIGNQVPNVIVVGNSWFVHPTGSSSNNGTSTAQAWDISTGFGGGVAGHLVQPGDTINILSGTYGASTTVYSPSVSGTSSKPVIITAFNGRASINCKSLQPTNSYCQFVSDPSTGNWLDFFRSVGNPGDGQDLVVMSNAGDGLEFIHIVIRNGAGVGISPQNETAISHSVYGCYVYNNGSDSILAPTYGHGIYAHGTTTSGATRNVENNIVFDNAGYGIHIFSESGNEQNVVINNNLSFFNGVGEGYDLLLGSSAQPLVNMSASFNAAIPLSTGGTACSVGYFSTEGGLNTSGYFTNNYIAGLLYVQSWDIATILNFNNNTCVGSGVQSIKLLFQSSSASFGQFVWDNNTYASSVAAGGGGRFAVLTSGGNTVFGTYDTIAQWNSATTLDAHSTFTQTTSGYLGIKTFLYPSKYNSKVGNLLIHNPPSSASVNVDISNVVVSGHTYSIYHVYDLFGTPVASGTYGGGTVSVPMSGSGKTPPAIPGGGLTPTNALPTVGGYVVIQTN